MVVVYVRAHFYAFMVVFYVRAHSYACLRSSPMSVHISMHIHSRSLCPCIFLFLFTVIFYVCAHFHAFLRSYSAHSIAHALNREFFCVFDGAGRVRNAICVCG